MKKKICISMFGLSLLLAAQSGFENQFVHFLRSGKIDTERSSETPSEFDRQGRDTRWRNTFGTGVLCPFYEMWRAKPTESDGPQSLTLKFNGTVNPGTVLAFGNDSVDTRFRLEGFDAPENGILVQPVMKDVEELKFTSTKLSPVLIHNWGSRTKIEVPLKTYQFALHGLYSMPEKRVNIASFAEAKVSGVSLPKKADAPYIMPSGINDGTVWKCWFSEKLKSGETAKAELRFPVPSVVREVVLYFGNRTYDFIPKSVRVTAFTREGRFDFGKLDDLKKETFKAKFFYCLKNPSPKRKIERLEFEFTPQKQVCAVGEILVLADPADNSGLEKNIFRKFSKEFSLPKNDRTFASAVIESKTGERIRNLAPALVRGDRFVFSWDGLDNDGKLVPADSYVLRGAVRKTLGVEYDSTPYMPNPIPWVTPDRKGGWLSDHVPASAIEECSGALWIGAPFAESGDTIMQLSPDGKKLWGIRWLNLSGAWNLRAQGGKLYVASGGGWTGQKIMVSELDPATKDFKCILNVEAPGKFAKKNWKERLFNGFAVDSGRLLVSYARLNRIDLYGKDGKKQKTLAVPAPGAMRFYPDGFYLISGNKLIVLDLESGVRKDIVSSGLLKPEDFVIHQDRIYIADSAAHRVKVFNRAGKLVGTIGKGVPRKAGKFDPEILDSPIAVAFDSRGRLWVSEFNELPKRLSVWTQNGTFVCDYSGPGRYEAGGWLDPDDINTYYAEGMIFKRVRGFWKLDSVYWDKRPAYMEIFAKQAAEPERAVKYNGKLYLIGDRHYSKNVVWYGLQNPSGVLKPHAAVGSYSAIESLFSQRPESFTGKAADYTFLWVNRNNDAQMDWNELQFEKSPFVKLQWSARMDRDLSFYWQSGKEVKKLSLSKNTPVPDYDLKSARTIRPLSRSEYLYAMSPLSGNKLLLNMRPLTCIEQTTGRTLWTYRNAFPSNSHDSPLPAPGDIQHTLNVEGEVSVPNFGDIFLLNGNKGVRYLFSGDGIYLGNLFADQRLAEPLAISNIRPGMDVSGYSLMDEAFCGSFERGANGKIYFSGGKNHNSIYEVKGLDTLNRFTQPVVFTAKERKLAEESKIEEIRIAKSGMIEKPYTLVSLNGKALRTVPEIAVFSNGRKFYSYRLAHDGTNLRGEFYVYDNSPFANRGNDSKMLFKSGDSVNLEFASGASRQPGIGDVRILIAPYQNKPVAVIYRYKVENSDSRSASEFTSPIGKTVVDQVEILKNARLHVEKRGDGYRVEFTIPLSEIPPLAKDSFVYDAGVIFSDDSGSRNSFNLFHHSPVKGVTADVPSEIRLSPQYMKTMTKDIGVQ